MVHNSGHAFVKKQAVALAKEKSKVLRRDFMQHVWLLDGVAFKTLQEVRAELKKD